MVSRQKSVLLLFLFVLASCVSCSGGSVSSVSGTITVDGAPVDAGTISMRPVGAKAGGPAGGTIDNGKFVVAARDGIKAGKYTVIVQASKKTGRKIKDPQKGEVEQLASLTLADSPKEIELTSANAENLELSFSTDSK